MAAFNMGQPMTTQPLGMVSAGMVAPMTGIPSMVQSIGSINTGMYMQNNGTILLVLIRILIFIFFFQVLELLRQ